MKGSYQRIQRNASHIFAGLDTPKGYKLEDFLGWSLYDPNSQEAKLSAMTPEERLELRKAEMKAIEDAFDY